GRQGGERLGRPPSRPRRGRLSARGRHPVRDLPGGADGSFSVTVLDGADTELGVELPGGELLLLGVSDGDDARLSAASTAEALLYYLIGGMWLPPEHQDTVRELLRGRG